MWYFGPTSLNASRRCVGMVKSELDILPELSTLVTF